MKELLEQISVAMGFDGEINEQVDQWVERVQDYYGYEDGELIAYIDSAVKYWISTGYLVCNGNQGIDMDIRIKAIRKNEKVGSGSCSTIDECWDTDEIIQELDSKGITTAEDAVKWALETEGIVLEQALNARWGSDDDEQLLRWKEF